MSDPVFRGNDDKVLDLDNWGPRQIKRLRKEALLRVAEEMAATLAADRKEFALDYYEPASEDVERVHLSNARVRFCGGGNGSSKTECSLVECVMMATGIIPSYFKDKFPQHDWKKKLRGPVSGRIVCQSITNTLQPIILPKLRWNCWTGTDEPGGERGHWGWIPKMCLIDGEWQKSWSEKNRLLRLLYRNPDNIDEVIGESRIQFQSYDVDAADQESGDLHFVLLDEPPTEAIYNANEARTMRVGGWIMLAMTWPDDPAIAVDWIFDRIYERGLPGPNKWPDYECFRLRTMKNKFINQTNVEKQRQAWDAQKRNSRLEGMPIRFSNRVHELFTDSPDEWCFSCGERQPIDEGHCTQCGSTDVVVFNHVADFDLGRGWPVIWVLDPHPRKPHMSAYFAVTPSDDWWMVAELEVKGDPTDQRIACDEMEAALDLRVVRRLIDPRMAANPSGAVRDRTWQDEFDAAGLYCEPADNSDTGRSIIDQYLRPDPHTKRPRILHHRRCTNATYQMKRFMWDDWRQGQDKAQKQKVKEKYDDFPACWRYMANTQATYEQLAQPPRIIRAGGMRRPEPRQYAAWR